MKNFLPLLAAAAFLGCVDSLPPAGTEVTLTLTQVDGKPLPFTVGVLTTGAAPTIVTGGTIVGNDLGPDCQLILTTNGDQIPVDINPCTINTGDVIDFPIDLGNNTGNHLYHFR